MVRIGSLKPRDRGTKAQISGQRPTKTDNLVDGAVTTPKLADGAVTAQKAAADMHTQAEADAHAGLPWPDAHPVPESAVDMNGQTIQNVGPASASGDALRKAELGQPDGIASLDSGGKIPVGQIPAVAITSITVVADIAARDALNPEEGDVARVLDKGDGEPFSYMWDGSDWKDLSVPSEVLSVAGKSGDVTLVKGDVGLGSVENFGIASKAEAEAGSSNTKYMTPLRAKEAIDALGVQVATGSYTGDSVDGREIAVGFSPRIVYIVNSTTTTSRSGWMWQPESAGPSIVFDTAGSRDHDNADKQMTANGFTVATSTPGDFNSSGTYYWVAYR